MLDGGNINMGMWGRKLYDNDVALDVKDAIEVAYDENDEETAINKIIAILNMEYTDDDDKSIAWLVAADRVLRRGTIDVSALYKTVCSGEGNLPDETISFIEEMLRNSDHRKKRRKHRKYCKTSWEVGDVYTYDIAPDYGEVQEFSGYTIGFLCIGYYEYQGKHPVVYTFRSVHTMDEIKLNPEIILHGDFWKVCNWSENKYTYRAVLWDEDEKYIPIKHLHYCGHTDIRPHISDEFVICDLASLPTFLWREIEKGLLRTRLLM